MDNVLHPYIHSGQYPRGIKEYNKHKEKERQTNLPQEKQKKKLYNHSHCRKVVFFFISLYKLSVVTWQTISICQGIKRKMIIYWNYIHVYTHYYKKFVSFITGSDGWRVMHNSFSYHLFDSPGLLPNICDVYNIIACSTKVHILLHRGLPWLYSHINTIKQFLASKYAILISREWPWGAWWLTHWARNQGLASSNPSPPIYI